MDRPQRHFIGAGSTRKPHEEIEKAAKALPPERKDGALAHCYELAGFLADAAESHKSALEKSPNLAAAHRAAAEFYLRMNRPGDAEALYRKVHERKFFASDDEFKFARRGLALSLARQQRPAKTAEALKLVGLSVDDKGLLIDTKFAEAFDESLLQAKVLGSFNHHRLREKAIALLETLHQKNLLNADDRFFLARLLVQNGGSADWVKARTLLKALVLEQPKNVRFLAFTATQFIQQKEYPDAEPMIVRLETVERERKATQGGFGSIELRAKIMEQRGLGLQAATLLSEYVKQPGAAPVRKLLLAQMHGRLGNYRDAIDCCVEVRQTASLQNEANAAAVAILRMNKPSEAQPTKFDQWVKQRERVEALLREAMQKDAKDVAARLHLADLMELQGKYSEVEKLCREVLAKMRSTCAEQSGMAAGPEIETAGEAVTDRTRSPSMAPACGIARHAPSRLESRPHRARVAGSRARRERSADADAALPPCRAYERSKNVRPRRRCCARRTKPD